MGTPAQPGGTKERRALARSIAHNREFARIASRLLDLDLSPRSRQLLAAGLILATAQAHRLAALGVDLSAPVAPAMEQNRLIARIAGLLLDDRPTVLAAYLLALAAVELNEQFHALALVARIRQQKG